MDGFIGDGLPFTSVLGSRSIEGELQLEQGACVGIVVW